MSAVVTSGGATPRRKNSAQRTRRQERSLQIHADQVASQDHVDLGGDEDRQEQRHRDVGNLDPLDEEAEDEDDETSGTRCRH